jgi:hypothetical protein
MDQHVIALEAGLHAMEEGKRGPAASRRAGEPADDGLQDELSCLQELIDSHRLREARTLADRLRNTIFRPSVAHPLRRRGAAMIKKVYQQDGDRDALLAFTQDEVLSLEGELIEVAGGRPLVPG